MSFERPAPRFLLSFGQLLEPVLETLVPTITTMLTQRHSRIRDSVQAASWLTDSRIVELCRGSELRVFSPALVTMSEKFCRQESNGRKEAAFNYSLPIWSS